jgi:alpha/beta superfamily hydrolase
MVAADQMFGIALQLMTRGTRQNGSMTSDVNPAAQPHGVAVLLHPHPDYGGNRYHPFITGLFRRLPAVDVTSVRFDFSSSDATAARKETLDAVDLASTTGPGVPIVLVGYSFGAGIAASVDDSRIAGWYLLAPPAASLAGAAIAADPRAKMIMVPEHDQFSPRPVVEQMVSGWAATSVRTARGVDHFLGDVGPVVDEALQWIAAASAGK